jgi:hypothetical protein
MEASMKMEARMKANRQQRIPEPEATKVTEDQIRARAYEIYLERNGEPGDPAADWLQAEAELNAPQLAKAQVA